MALDSYYNDRRERPRRQSERRTERRAASRRTDERRGFLRRTHNSGWASVVSTDTRTPRRQSDLSAAVAPETSERRDTERRDDDRRSNDRRVNDRRFCDRRAFSSERNDRRATARPYVLSAIVAGSS